MVGRIPLWSQLILDFRLLGVFKMSHSISLLEISLFFFISFGAGLGACIFLGFCPFLVNCLFSWYIAVGVTFINIGISVVSVLISCFFFVSEFTVFDPISFSLLHLAKSLLILSLHRLNSSFHGFIFSILKSVYLCSDLYDFIPSTNFGFLCSSFSSFFRGKSRFFEFFVSWDKLVLL